MGILRNIFIWSASKWVPSLQFSFKALVQLWGYGFRMFLAGLLDAVFTRLDYLIIGKLFMPETLGFFQRAKSLNLFVVRYSSASLMSVLFPVLSKIQNDLPRFQNIVLKTLGIISFITSLLLGGLYLVSEDLIVLLFGAKWLPSVKFFKILVLSGFGYPVSALLVNVLSSRGKSKLFLRLEIYKKLLVCINLYVLFAWGIDIYLYGLIVKAVLGVSLNIFFASREIQLKFFEFVKPLVIQAVITVVAVLTTLSLVAVSGIDGSLLLIFVNGLSFASIYFLVSWSFKTSSYSSFAGQVIPLVRARF